MDKVSQIQSQAFNVFLRLVGRSNPLFFLDAVTQGEPQQLPDVLRYLNPTDGITVFTNPSLFEAAWAESAKDPENQALADRSRMKVETPAHVFPVCDAVFDSGFLVPVEISPAREWHVSDVFGTFGGLGDARDPQASLVALLKLVENSWQTCFGGYLPLRLMSTLSLQVPGQIHLSLFQGESLQVPLLVGVLRVLAGRPREDGLLDLALGQGPVFASGKVGKDGAFLKIESLEQKLTGFVREMGEGWLAILTGAQEEELKGTALLDRVNVRRANSIAELLHFPEIEAGLRRLADDYHPSLNDRVMRHVEMLSRKLEFDEARALSGWVLSRVQSDCYRFAFSCHSALTLFHGGHFVEARRHAAEAQNCLARSPNLFGADDWGRLVEVVCDGSIDSCREDLFSDLLKSLPASAAENMTGRHRTTFYGCLCQFHWMFGRFGEAIEAGRRAVAIADLAYSSTAGQSRNYLAHALIASCRESEKPDPAWLQEAAVVLNEAKGEWAPRDYYSSRRSHLGFCMHLEAELARLTGRPFTPTEPLREGYWGHPWLFTLISAVRNEANPVDYRESALEELLRCSEGYVKRAGAQSLFGLFDAVYRLYEVAWRGVDQTPAEGALLNWLAEQEQERAGWELYLRPLIRPGMSLAVAGELVDAIRYH